ncbi:hypothetical protein G6F66_014219 [Rhizopus arrhizus]|nr:hypothetical protein G6F66_014219 [Rhizopus arrhizus]
MGAPACASAPPGQCRAWIRPCAGALRQLSGAGAACSTIMSPLFSPWASQILRPTGLTGNSRPLAKAGREGRRGPALVGRCGLRQGQHVQVGRHRRRQLRGAGQCQRHRLQPDQQQGDRKHPACGVQVRALAQFHHPDMELVGQGKGRDRAQRDHGEVVRDDGRWRQLRHPVQQRHAGPVHRQCRIQANGQQRGQLQQ